MGVTYAIVHKAESLWTGLFTGPVHLLLLDQWPKVLNEALSKKHGDIITKTQDTCRRPDP